MTNKRPPRATRTRCPVCRRVKGHKLDCHLRTVWRPRPDTSGEPAS